MDRFEAMRTLVAAVDGGSLSAASRRMGVPLPTVSRRVSDLEAHLRAQLVVRTSRRLILTEAGRAFVGTCRRVLDELDEAERAAAGEYRAPRGHLQITAPVMFGRLHVEPVVLSFLAAFPEISARLTLIDGVIDLIEQRIDAAVRIGPLPDSSLVAIRLGHVRWTLCASPDYLARRGIPQTPADLAAHDCIAFDRAGDGMRWAFAGDAEHTFAPRFAVNTAGGAIDAALGHTGIARVLSYQIADSCAAGRLVPVLEKWAPDALPVHLVHAGHAIPPLKLRAFLDHAAPALKARLEQA